MRANSPHWATAVTPSGVKRGSVSASVERGNATEACLHKEQSLKIPVYKTGSKRNKDWHLKEGVADTLPWGRAGYFHLHSKLLLPHSVLLQHAIFSELHTRGGAVGHTHTHLVALLQRGVVPAPTIKSCDPEDLCDVNGNDIQAAGSSLSQESDHGLQKLWREGGDMIYFVFIQGSNEGRQHSDHAGVGDGGMCRQLRCNLLCWIMWKNKWHLQ